MELIIFIGLQASGKSSFYKQYFFNSHLRISLDLLNTRNKEAKFLATAFEVQQKIVVDNTNPTVLDRQKYIDSAKLHKYKVIAYFFHSNLTDCLARNALREGKEKINEKGLWATHKKLTPPTYEEGFDELFFVSLTTNGFTVKNWQEYVV